MLGGSGERGDHDEAIAIGGVHQGRRKRPTTSGAGHRQEQHGHIGELPAHLPLHHADQPAAHASLRGRRVSARENGRDRRPWARSVRGREEANTDGVARRRHDRPPRAGADARPVGAGVRGQDPATAPSGGSGIPGAQKVG